MNLVLSAKGLAQIRIPGPGGTLAASVTAIVREAACTGVTGGSTAINIGCSSGMVVSAGSTISCFGFSNSASFDPVNLLFNDVINGNYKAVYGYSHLTSANIWVAAATFENSVAGTITPYVKNWEATGLGISCEALKNVPTFGVLDGGVVNLTNSATGTNPTAGSVATPTNANEFVTCQLIRNGTTTVTAGSGMSPAGILTAVATSTIVLAQYTEYQIQTTATSLNCPYTIVGSAQYRDSQIALLNIANAGTGYSGLTGSLAPANTQSNGSNVTAGTLNTISGASAGSLTPLNADSSTWWSLLAGSGVTWDTGVSPLGTLRLMINGQKHILGDAGVSFHWSAADVTSTYRYVQKGHLNTGQAMWLGAFIRVGAGVTNGTGCDTLTVLNSAIDSSMTLQTHYDSTLKLGYDMEAQDSSVSGTYSPGAILAQDYFEILKVGGVNDTNNEVYIFSQATPGSGPWTQLGTVTTKAIVKTPAATTTGTTTAGSKNLTVLSGTGLAIGQPIGMAGVQAGITLASGSGTSWVMSQEATTTQVAVTAKFWAAASVPFEYHFGKYSSCSLDGGMWFSGVLFDPLGNILPYIANGTLNL